MTTGLKTNQLFPLLLVSLIVTVLFAVYSVITQQFLTPISTSDSTGTSSSNSVAVGESVLPLLVALVPLGIGAWGATLFKSGRGFAASAQGSGGKATSTD